MQAHKAIHEKRFPEDLLYRIAKFKIEISQPRRRIEDIPELVLHFLATKFQNKVMITPQAIGLLQSYYWPGNALKKQLLMPTVIERW